MKVTVLRDVKILYDQCITVAENIRQEAMETLGKELGDKYLCIIHLHYTVPKISIVDLHTDCSEYLMYSLRQDEVCLENDNSTYSSQTVEEITNLLNTILYNKGIS